MQKKTLVLLALSAPIVLFQFCSKKENTAAPSYPAIQAAFAGKIDLQNLANYASQSKPAYIIKDNTGSNVITDKKATLGRVLFYDKNLSIDNSISCGSCHKQEFAFSDTALASRG